MEINNISCRIRISPLTPLHIGGTQAKNWCEGVDYMFNKDECITYILDQKKIANLLNQDQLVNYSQALLNRNASHFLLDLMKRLNISAKEISLFAYSSQQPENDIKAHIRDGSGKPYIPGSSVKGAIRSVLFNRLFNEDKYNSDFNSPGSKRISQDEYVFGNISKNLMHFIQVSDIIFQDTELFATKVFNLYDDQSGKYKAGWKNAQKNDTSREFINYGFTTTYETLSPGMTGYGTLKMDTQYVNYLQNFAKSNLPGNVGKVFTDNPVRDLIRLINAYSLSHIDKEIAFFSAYPNDATDLIINELNQIKVHAENKTLSCVLRMACGSGFHGITGDWQFENHKIDNIANFKGRSRGQYNGKDSSKSRKIAFAEFEDSGQRFIPMGFIRISLVKDKEVK